MKIIMIKIFCQIENNGQILVIKNMPFNFFFCVKTYNYCFSINENPKDEWQKTSENKLKIVKKDNKKGYI